MELYIMKLIILKGLVIETWIMKNNNVEFANTKFLYNLTIE